MKVKIVLQKGPSKAIAAKRVELRFAENAQIVHVFADGVIRFTIPVKDVLLVDWGLDEKILQKARKAALHKQQPSYLNEQAKINRVHQEMQKENTQE